VDAWTENLCVILIGRGRKSGRSAIFAVIHKDKGLAHVCTTASPRKSEEKKR